MPRYDLWRVPVLSFFDLAVLTHQADYWKFFVAYLLTLFCYDRQNTYLQSHPWTVKFIKYWSTFCILSGYANKSDIYFYRIRLLDTKLQNHFNYFTLLCTLIPHIATMNDYTFVECHVVTGKKSSEQRCNYIDSIFFIFNGL